MILIRGYELQSSYAHIGFNHPNLGVFRVFDDPIYFGNFNSCIRTLSWLNRIFVCPIQSLFLCRSGNTVLSCAYLIRRQGFRVLLGIIFALLSLVIWYLVSTEDRFSLLEFQYNVIALGLWAGGSCILLAAHEKKVKRRHFSALVKVHRYKTKEQMRNM